MKKIIIIIALFLVSIAGFSQQTCSMRINNPLPGATTFTATFNLYRTTTPILLVESFTNVSVYLLQTNDQVFTYACPPNQTWRYQVIVKDITNNVTATGYSQEFSTQRYRTNDIPVIVTF